MRLFLLVALVSAATAYHPLRFKSTVAAPPVCDGPAVGVDPEQDTSHCGGNPPPLPRPSGATQPRLASRTSTRGQKGWRESKDILGTPFRTGVPEGNKCANLQASCKCGGEGVTDPAQAVDVLLKDAEVYNPIFEGLMHSLVKEAAGKTDANGFEWRKPEIDTAPIKGKPRCVEKIKQK